MATKDITKIDGVVTEALPNTMFRVELSDGRVILTTLKGKMRRRYVRVFRKDSL
ncbi:MAG: translation initiation factor IF-1 [Patescibacteria group bacterium]